MINYYKDFLHKAANNVYYWWEENRYINEGLGRVDKVCQFSDWVDACDNESLASIGGVACNFEDGIFIRHLRATINKAINEWLDGGLKWLEQ